MGDFDRFEKPSQGGETKKLVMVVMLGAGLLGVVGYQMFKHGPQPAGAAAIAAEATELPVVSETPSSLRQALKDDPTTPLLPNDAATAPAIKAPRNPFRMGSAWLAQMHRPPAPMVVKDPVKAPLVSIPRPVEPVQPQAVRLEDYRLNVISNSGVPTAIINNKVVRTGDIVGKARVMEISGDHVTLQHVDFPDGPMTTLTMQPRFGP